MRYSQESCLEGLSQEDQGFVLESDARSAVAKEILETPLSFKEKVELFWNDTKERFGVGKFVHRAEVVGGVGDVLHVEINGVDLGKYLPEGVVFRGNRFSSEFKDDYTVPFPSPFYDPYSREVCIIVAKDAGVSGKVTDEIKYSGLVVLHEVGHSIDDSRRLERLNEVERLQTVERLYRTCASGGLSWLSESHFQVLSRGGAFDEERIREEVVEFVSSKLSKEVSATGKYALRERLLVRGIDENDFVAKVGAEVAATVYGIYTDAANSARLGNVDEAGIGVRQAFETRITETHDAYEDAMSSESAKSERQAWAEALVIARKLTRESGVRLWDGELKDLYFFIDKLINAHGLTAGRKGVKNPYSRAALHIPD